MKAPNLWEESDKALLGRSYDEVTKELRDRGVNYRVAVRNGNNRFLTQDVKLDRINLYVENDIVTKVHRG